MRVLITGAGIAGNALAFWLAKLGHTVTVIERWPELRASGLQVDLRGHGIRVMKLMGIEPQIRSKLVHEEGIALVDSSSRQRAWFPANTSGKGAQSFSSEFEIMRSDLCRVLYDAAVEEGAEYWFGMCVESLSEEGGVVEVRFEDGTRREYDLVCGCDGLGSKLRKIMFNKEGDRIFTELPERTAYFTMPKPIEEGERYIATGYIMTDKRFAMTRRHSPTSIQVYLKCETNFESVRNMKRGDTASEKQVFSEVFRDSGWKTNELVKALQEGAEDWYCQYSGFVESENWSKGHVTLVGDAAHGVPADGMGTSAALIGAYILAGEIDRHCSNGQNMNAERGEDGISEAISAYERKFKPYIKETQKGMSAEPSLWDRIPSNSFTVGLTLYMASFASLIRLDAILMRFFEDGGVKGFKMPQYEIAVA